MAESADALEDVFGEAPAGSPAQEDSDYVAGRE